MNFEVLTQPLDQSYKRCSLSILNQILICLCPKHPEHANLQSDHYQSCKQQKYNGSLSKQFKKLKSITDIGRNSSLNNKVKSKSDYLKKYNKINDVRYSSSKLAQQQINNFIKLPKVRQEIQKIDKKIDKLRQHKIQCCKNESNMLQSNKQITNKESSKLLKHIKLNAQNKKQRVQSSYNNSNQQNTQYQKRLKDQGIIKSRKNSIIDIKNVIRVIQTQQIKQHSIFNEVILNKSGLYKQDLEKYEKFWKKSETSYQISNNIRNKYLLKKIQSKKCDQNEIYTK